MTTGLADAAWYESRTVKRVWHLLLGAPISASLLGSTPASADGAPPIAAAAAAPTSNEVAAAAAYQSALDAYRDGDVAAALSGMRESYRISQRKELLYNVAQLERELGHCQAALSNYRDYLGGASQGKYRLKAEQASLQLEAECPDPAPVSFSPPPGPPPVLLPKLAVEPGPARYWTAPRVLGWSAIAAGAIAGGAAVGFTLSAKSARDAVQASVDRQAMGGPHWDEAAQRDQHRSQTWAQIFGVGAGALVAGGVLLVLLDPGHEHAQQANLSVSFQPSGAQACYSHTF